VIRTRRSGDVLTITLDRPARRNAVTREGLAELKAAVAEATAPVVYLHGAGEAFCAGADRDEVAALDAEAAAGFAADGQDVADALATYDGAVVAGVDGAARGGGVELALACDVRVCTPDATFAENGVELGLFGAWGGTARLPAVVGPGAAMDLALTGRVVDAETARELGLVSQVRDSPRTVAERIADHDADAVRAIGDLVGDGRGAVPRRTAQGERAAFAALVADRDEKRKG